MTAIPALIERLGHMPLITQPQRLRLKSRDFYWYSPVLKRQLHDLCAELVACPRHEADVIDVARACFDTDTPLTVRGAGTGNYGQAMPMKGGVVLDMSGMNRINRIGKGAVRCEAGAIIAEVDRAAQSQSGQELRFHPSTWATASIGGFVAGGSSGIGSITHGLLRDPGNVLAARVVTVEAAPRALELTEDDLAKVNHAYGTNGILTEVEMPLAPAHPWAEMIVAHADFAALCRAAQALGEDGAVTKKLVCALAAPIVHEFFPPFEGRVGEREHALLVMVREDHAEAVAERLGASGGRIVYRRSPDEALERGTQPLFEYSWNHTTLQALKRDRSITYLQTLFPPPDHLAKVERMRGLFGDEVPMHLEFVRLGDEVACFGLQLVRYTTDERLAEIIEAHEQAGCPIFNPHVYTLEEGGMKQVDRLQLAFKREADPKGLLNPGKMLAWDDPDWDARQAERYHLYAAK